MKINSVIHLLPKYHEKLDMFDGYRACIANVPGCVLIGRDRGKILDIMKIAHEALLEEPELNN